MLNLLRNNEIPTSLQYQMYMVIPRSIKDLIDMGALASRISRAEEDVGTIYNNEFKSDNKRGLLLRVLM